MGVLDVRAVLGQGRGGPGSEGPPSGQPAGWGAHLLLTEKGGLSAGALGLVCGVRRPSQEGPQAERESLVCGLWRPSQEGPRAERESHLSSQLEECLGDQRR